MYPKQESHVTLESWKPILVDTPEKRLKLYFDVAWQLKGQRLRNAIHRNRHRLLIEEQMKLLGAVLDKDGFIVCNSCLKNQCDCWFSKQIFKACIQHRRYLAAEQSTNSRIEALTAGLAKLKENLDGIGRYLKPPPSKFVMWACECDVSRVKVMLAEREHALSFGYDEWPKRPGV